MTHLRLLLPLVGYLGLWFGMFYGSLFAVASIIWILDRL